MMEKESKKLVKNSIIMTSIGFLLMMIATTIVYFGMHNLLLAFMVVMLEPSGWFLMWTGLDQIFYKRREEKPELEFYNKNPSCERNVLKLIDETRVIFE